MRMYTSWVPWTVRQVCVNVVWLSFSLGEICNSFSSFLKRIFSYALSQSLFLSFSRFLSFSVSFLLSLARGATKSIFCTRIKERTNEQVRNSRIKYTKILNLHKVHDMHKRDSLKFAVNSVKKRRKLFAKHSVQQRVGKKPEWLTWSLLFLLFSFFFLLRTLCCATFWHEMAKGCESFSIENSEDALKSVSFGWKVCYVFDRVFWLVNSIKSFFYLNTLLLGIFERKMCTFSCRIVLFQ